MIRMAPATAKKPVRIYADVICDLYHYGHVNFFRLARALGDELIVGVNGDELGDYKPRPILSMEERAAVVESCRYVDRVLRNVPLHADCAFLDSIGADYLCHGNDYTPEMIAEYYTDLEAANRLRMVPYTSAISTTEIIRRIAQRIKEGTLDAKL